MPERHTINLANIQLSYLEWNRGEENQTLTPPGMGRKEPLLLLHGLADHGNVWLSLGDYLGEKYHIIAPDLRGHGESSKPETGYSFADFISDLEELMVSLGWKNAHVVAHSWSAKLLPIWATQHPERFRSLTLVDPFFIEKIPRIFELSFPILYRVLPFLKTMGPFPSYEAAEELAKKLKQYQGWSELQQQVFKTGIEQKSDGSWGSKFVIAARDGVFAEVMRVAGLTVPIDIPTLFIKPVKGLNRTEWQMKPYKKYLQNLNVCEVPGNHWAFLVEPEAFNRTVEKFLTEQIK